MRRLRSIFLASTALLAAVSSAQSLGTANDFNAFILGTAALNGGHADGAVAVGGQITGSGYDFLQKNEPATLDIFNKIGLYANSGVAFTNGGSVNNGGTAHVANSFSSGNPFNMNGGTLYAGGTITNVNGSKVAGTNTVDSSVFSSQAAYSLAQTQAIRNLSGFNVVGGGPAWPNVLEIDLSTIAADSNNRKVLKLDASLINGAPNAVLNLKNQGSETVLFDVTGSGSLNWSWTTNTSDASKLLFNFKDLSSITLNRTFTGSMLALGATVTQQTGNIQGNLIAQNWVNNNSNELHGGQYAFSGSAPVPEPAGILLVVGAIGAMAVRRKMA